MDDATPTLSSKVNSRSRTGVAVSIFAGVSQANASVSLSACKGVLRALSQMFDDSAGLLYFSFPNEQET